MATEEVLYWPGFFGYMGVASALIFANAGAAYGTARSGNGLAGMAITNPSAAIKSIIPIIMAGILGIYGLIVAVILLGQIKSPAEGYSANMGFAHLAAGLSCGLSSLRAGFAIGIAGDYGVRAVGRQPKVYVGLILILIFAEAIGLFGLIVALVISTSVTK